MKKNVDLKIIKKILIFSFPIIMAGLINVIFSFATIYMVAHLGKLELAAGALAVPTYFTLLTLSSASLYAVGILISHAKSGDPKIIGRFVKNGFFVACGLSFFSGVLLWNADDFLKLLGQNPVLLLIVRPYFHYAALGTLPVLIMATVAQFYTGIGKPRFTLIISALKLPFSILLAYGFVLGNFGFPHLGLAGGMCATFIVESVVIVMICAYLIVNKSTKQYAIFSGPFWPDIVMCRKLLSIGLPIGVQFCAELGAMTTATYMMGHFGVIPLAAAQIVSQYAVLIVMVWLGFSQAISVLVSEAYGKQAFDLIEQYIRSALYILAGFSAVIIGLFSTVPAWFVHFFIVHGSLKDACLIHLSTQFLFISAVFLSIDAVRNTLSSSLRGLHESKTPMLVGVLSLWLISLPISYLAAFTFQGGPLGLRWGFVSGFVVAVIILWCKVRGHLIRNACARA